MPHGPFAWGWFEDDPLDAAPKDAGQDETVSDDGDDDLDARRASDLTVPTAKPTHED